MSCYHNMTYYFTFFYQQEAYSLLGQGPHPRSIHQLEHQQEGPFLGALGVHHPIRDEAPQRLDGELRTWRHYPTDLGDPAKKAFFGDSKGVFVVISTGDL